MFVTVIINQGKCLNRGFVKIKHQGVRGELPGLIDLIQFLHWEGNTSVIDRIPLLILMC